MKIISDLHIHGPYSRATSKNINFALLEKYARVKGLTLLGTGDFQHPKWNKEIKEKLREDENGILWSNTDFPFIWQTEISLIYTDAGKGRRVHNVILSPNKEVSDQIINALSKKGRLDYDGRPIFGFSCVELVNIMKAIDPNIEIIPAHIWTTHFSLMGEYNKYLSVEECFKENTKYIHALETGMSSDPAMNWRVSGVNQFNLVSFSDSHSYWPWRMGREATIFDLDELTYTNIIKAIRTGEGLSSTIETPPEYGKYHFTGHRECNVFLSPNESLNVKGICPICKRNLTIGVAERVQELTDETQEYKPINAKPFIRLVPLHELISACYGIEQLSSKKIWLVYNKLIDKFGSEFKILLEISKEDLSKIIESKLVELIMLNRSQKLNIKPGADGEYGKLTLNPFRKDSEESSNPKKQKSLMDF